MRVNNNLDETPWLIVGLGNPGSKYERTWHNVGFMTLEILSQRHKIPINKIKFKGLYGRGRIDDNTVIFLKPTTYMNLSGESVREAASYFRVPSERVLIIYDDLDIETGLVRIRQRGGPGTHNGMKSVVNCLATEDFPRIRVGIGPLPDRWQLVDYVLSEIPDERKQNCYDGLTTAADAVELAVRKGIDLAMNRCNIRKKQKQEDDKW
jgi:PTH1 family peptidyl-tRNA hydrolase